MILGQRIGRFSRLPFGCFSTSTTDLLCIVLKTYTSLLSCHQTAVSWLAVANSKHLGSIVSSGMSCTGKSFLFALTVPTQYYLLANLAATGGRYRNCQQKQCPLPWYYALSASSLHDIQGLSLQGQLQHQYIMSKSNTYPVLASASTQTLILNQVSFFGNIL